MKVTKAVYMIPSTSPNITSYYEEITMRDQNKSQKYRNKTEQREQLGMMNKIMET